MTVTNDKTLPESGRTRTLWNGAVLIYFVLSVLFAARATAAVELDARDTRAGESQVEVRIKG